MVELQTGEIVEGRYKIVSRIGGGYAATVYRVLQGSIGTERAMKVLDPKKVTTKAGQKEFREGFLNEIRKLSPLTHRNLIKLIDAGEHRSKRGSREKLLYYVMDLVHPPKRQKSPLTLDKWALKVDKRDSFVNVILQLTNGLSYLHSRRILHFDIKPANVLLEPLSDGQYDVKIGDLGSSKVIPNRQARDLGQTCVIGTPLYGPTYAYELVRKSQTGTLNNMPIPVTRSILRKWFPHYDLFCLGATLAEAVSTTKINPTQREFAKMLESPKENVRRIFGDDYHVLSQIILRLVHENKSACFESADDVGEAFRKFRPEYLVPLGVEEMAVGGAHRTLTQPREKVYLSARAYELIEHPAFQRLHNLNQLNFVYMLYSGAKHSRFLHSLSTYEMAKRYIEGLLGDPYFKYLMCKKDFELILAASLLHDIGQYPLAHAIEDLQGISLNGVSSGVKADYDMSKYFLNRPGKGNKPKLADVLEKGWGIDVEKLGRVLWKEPRQTDAEHLIRSMLDGAIDIDKVSYLLYDSYFTGARYGLGIDLDGLLSSLVAIPPDASSERETQIGVSDAGVVAAEGVISARYSMFSRIYWHHFNRAIIAMLKYAAAKIFLSSKRGCSFDGYINDTFGFSDLDAVHYLHDRLGRVVSLKGPNPLEGILDGSRTVHRRFLTFSGEPGSKTGAIYRHLMGHKGDLEALEGLRLTVLEKLEIELGEKLKDHDVLFDVPGSEKTSDLLKELFVYDPHDPEKYKKLRDLSDVTRALCDEFDNLTKKCRIYIAAGLREKLDRDDKIAKRVKGKIEGDLKALADKKGL
jgi:serine/threonine protein kinase